MKIILVVFLSLCMVFSAYADSNREDNPFGVLAFLAWNHHWNSYMYESKEEVDKAISLLDQLGVSIVRIDFSWNLIEEQKGYFDFDRYDHIVDRCREKGIEILAVLGYSAPWTGAEWNQPPPDKEDFLNYVQTTVSRYKNKIRYWEIWNEPDSFFYWQPQDSMETYTRLLKLVYPAIKEIDSENTVLLGGLTQSGFFALKDILGQGGGDYFDIANFHFFVNPLKDNNLDQIKYILEHIQKELRNYQLDEKIWLTEIGAPGKNRGRDCLWWMGRCPTEREQAKFLKRAYDFLLNQDKVEKIFWAFFQDTTDHFNTGVDYFGLIRTDFSPKPAFHKYKRIINKWEKYGDN